MQNNHSTVQPFNRSTIDDVKSKIRAVPDFPKEGILFRDITTALKEPETLRSIIDYLCEQFKDEKIDYVAGIESRGFILGMPIAYKLNAGFVPIRKSNKLPAATYSESYDLEYGTDTLEVHKDAMGEGARVLIVDDLLATGGTAQAACKLVKKTGAELVGTAFLIELTALNGREKLQGEKIVVMLDY
jgi:adenine phosphoribosyltransferase